MKQLSLLISGVFCMLSFSACAQQKADTDFTPDIPKPLFENGKGPHIVIDGGHYNFHSFDGRYAAFAKIATMDGFKVSGKEGAITKEYLNGIKILVIANALNEKNVDEWKKPTLPAFTEAEVNAITTWVRDGGSLFLIADHMPFGGAAASLAEQFGFIFKDGFALTGPGTRFDMFSYADNTLEHNAITDMHEPIDSVVSFTGQAFTIPDGATSIITLDKRYKVLLPEEAWKFSRETPMEDAEGMSQLAYLTFGRGKVVASGEAAMFTAQIAGNNVKMGLNNEIAKNNVPLLLNILEWLAQD